MGFVAIYRKTVADLSNPKILLGYYVPYLVIAGMTAFGMTDNEFDNLVTVAQQQTELASSFAFLAFFLAVGFPFLALVAVLTANTVAKEAEDGTLRILLSKPTPRWKVVLASFAAVVTFSGLVALANLLLPAAAMFIWSGVDTAAISGGLFTWIPGYLAYGLFGAFVTTSIGLALSVRTADRLKTTLGTFLVPALYFAFLPIRLLAHDMYEDFYLYLFDINYHFGHAFVFIQESLGGEFSSEMQEFLSVPTGVYEVPEEEPGQLPETVELVEYVPLEMSVVLLSLLGLCSLSIAVYRFQRIDV